MSDLTANNCGCNSAVSNSWGNCFGCDFIWIIILISLFNNNRDCGCGCGSGILGGGSGCGNNSCEWLIWILLISCFCGNNHSCC